MTTRIVNIIPATLAGDSETTHYTVDTLSTVIDKFTATNTGASNAVLSIYLVPPSGSAGASNQIIKDQMIIPNEEFIGLEVIGHYLMQGGSIVTDCSTNTVNIMASGREIS